MNDIRAEHINAALSSYEAARTGFFTLYLPNDLNDFAKRVICGLGNYEIKRG